MSAGNDSQHCLSEIEGDYSGDCGLLSFRTRANRPLPQPTSSTRPRLDLRKTQNQLHVKNPRIDCGRKMLLVRRGLVEAPANVRKRCRGRRLRAA